MSARVLSVEAPPRPAILPVVLQSPHLLLVAVLQELVQLVFLVPVLPVAAPPRPVFLPAVLQSPHLLLVAVLSGTYGLVFPCPGADG